MCSEKRSSSDRDVWKRRKRFGSLVFVPNKYIKYFKVAHHKLYGRMGWPTWVGELWSLRITYAAFTCPLF